MLCSNNHVTKLIAMNLGMSLLSFIVNMLDLQLGVFLLDLEIQ